MGHVPFLLFIYVVDRHEPIIMSSSIVKIRVATEADLIAINAIYNEAVLQTIATMDTIPKTIEERMDWFNKNRLPIHTILIVEADAEVRGWASLNAHSDRIAYSRTVDNSIYIYQKYQGLGYGTLLMTELMRLAKENNFHNVIAKIADGNVASVKLHEKFGFIKVGVMTEVGWKFDRWIDVWILQKVIS